MVKTISLGFDPFDVPDPAGMSFEAAIRGDAGYGDARLLGPYFITGQIDRPSWEVEVFLTPDAAAAEHRSRVSMAILPDGTLEYGVADYLECPGCGKLSMREVALAGGTGEHCSACGRMTGPIR